MSLNYKLQMTNYKFRALAIVILVLFGIYFLGFGVLVKAQNCGSDLQCQIDAISREIAALSPAQQKNKADLATLNKQISDLSSRINTLSTKLKDLTNSIAKREKDLEYTKVIFEEKAKYHYTYLRLYDPVTPYLFSDSASKAFQEIALRQRAIDEDRKIMDKYSKDLESLQKDKEIAENSKKSLSASQAQLTEKQKFLAGEVAKVDSYLSSLTAKQQALEAEKAGGFSTTVGDVPGSAEPCSGKPGASNFCDPGFRPAFGAFSYGAPHRKGMSQYGAYGRAKAGQSAEDILRAYYGGIELKKDYSTNINITVSGYGSVNIETYVKRIYEMPGSWTDNNSAALKAQAVAARSYALAYTNNGAKSICATESCQVYKPSNKGGAWDAAVEATRGWVLVSGGAPFSAWYASTSGGYTFGYSSQGHSSPNLWDTPSGKNGWPNSAYEIAGGSPWFYKGWFKSRAGASCGRNNPWLTSAEMADILNARYVLDGNGDTSRVTPVSCWGGNPYSMSELAGMGGYSSVSGVSVVYGNDGATSSITLDTNKGTITLSGSKFKEAFNLRAPGYIGLKSTLFNIEKL